MKKPARYVLEELWYNRPWKYIPAVGKYMKEHPFSESADNVVKYTYNCMRAAWKKHYVHAGHVVIYNECYQCACRGCTNADCMKSRCAVCDHLAGTDHKCGRPVVVCGRTNVFMEGFNNGI